MGRVKFFRVKKTKIFLIFRKYFIYVPKKNKNRQTYCNNII